MILIDHPEIVSLRAVNYKFIRKHEISKIKIGKFKKIQIKSEYIIKKSD